MNLKTQVLQELRNTHFPINYSRTNVATCNQKVEAFALGLAPYRGSTNQGGRVKGPSQWNKKFPNLYRLLKKFIAETHPDFKYTTIQVNKNLECLPHIDKNNVGDSYIIALGDFIGGELTIEGQNYNIRNRWKRFDGRKAHWVEPFEGERYSLVFFTHTFKPPAMETRNLIVAKSGIFKQISDSKKILITSFR
jgi:hypothetical protein